MKNHSEIFPFIPNSIFFDPDISHLDVRIYGIIFALDSKVNGRKRRAMFLSEALDYGKDLDVSNEAVINISHGKLAKFLNCSKAWARQGVKNLYETGWLDIIPCLGRSNFYLLNTEPKRMKLAQNLAVYV